MHVVTYELEPHELAHFSPDCHDRLAVVTEGLVSQYGHPPGIALTGSPEAFNRILHDVPDAQRIGAVQPYFNASLNTGMYVIRACLPLLVIRKVNRRFKEHFIVHDLLYDYQLAENASYAGTVTLHAAGMTPLRCYDDDAGLMEFSMPRRMLSGSSVAAGIATILFSYQSEGLPEGTCWELSGVKAHIPRQRTAGM